MALKFRIPFQALRSPIPMLIALVAAWLTLSASSPDLGLFTRIAWVLLSALSSVLLLGFFEYFHQLRPLPELGDLSFVAVAVSGPALLWSMVLGGPTGLGAASLWVVLFVHGVDLGLHVLGFRSGKRLRYFSVLHEGEEAAWGTLLSRLEMRGYFERVQEPTRAEFILYSRSLPLAFRTHARAIELRTAMAQISGCLDLSQQSAWSFLMEATPTSPLKRSYFIAKFYYEPLLAAVLAALLAPLWIGVALAVRLESSGPVLFRQRRLGFGGAEFEMVKFRTMRVDAESSGPRWSSHDDPRVTRIGTFLRRTRLDELPQLWNVMRGEMGFIGPRPERPEFYDELEREIPDFRLRTAVRPGISGLAQVRSGYAASVEESRVKLQHDLEYIREMSPQLDSRIVGQTFKVLWSGLSGRD